MVDALQVHGVDTIFCVPGESYLAVLDALHDAEDAISVITCRHENGAAFMGEAYGKLTGKPGVTFVTRGPGACNGRSHAACSCRPRFSAKLPTRPDFGRDLALVFRDGELELDRPCAPLGLRADRRARGQQVGGNSHAAALHPVSALRVVAYDAARLLAGRRSLRGARIHLRS